MPEEIRADLDLDISDLKEALEDMTESIDDLSEVLVSGHQDFMRKSAEKAESMKGLGDAAQNMEKEFETAQKGIISRIANIGEEWTNTVDEMRKAGGTKGIVGETLPRQLGGVQDTFKTFKQSMLSELPFGGIFGLMVLGGKRDEEVRAMGAKVSRLFQETGQVGRKEMQRVGNTVRQLGVELGKGPMGLAGEFEATASVFARGGIQIEEVLQDDILGPIEKSRGSILETTIALDSLFKLGAGTSARMMVDMSRNFNVGIEESQKLMASLGLQAREAGVSVSGFMQSVMRSSQVLRTQRVDITEVAEAQLKMKEIMEETGMERPMAARYAEEAVGQLTQGLAGMSTGLTSVLGERITARGGLGERQVTGLESYYAMREGFAGEGQEPGEQGIFTQSIRELISLTQEMGGTEHEQRYFLEKQGFGIEGSRAIMEMSERIEDMKEMGADEKDINKAIEEHQGELKNAFVNREQETSDFQKALLKIQDGIAQIGAGLLSATVSGLQNLVEIGRLIWNYISGGPEEERDFILKEMERNAKRSTQAVDKIMEGVNQTFRGLEEGTATAIGFGSEGTRESRRQAFYAGEGKGVKVGERYMSEQEFGELRESAERKRTQMGASEFGSLMRAMDIEAPTRTVGGPGGMGGGVVGGTAYRELMKAFKEGGREAATATYKELRREGKVEAKAGGRTLTAKQFGAITGAAEETGARTVMDIGGGEEMDVRAILKLEAGRRRKKHKSAEDG